MKHNRFYNFNSILICFVFLLSQHITLAAVAPNSPLSIKSNINAGSPGIDSYLFKKREEDSSLVTNTDNGGVFLTIQEFLEVVPIGEGEGALIFKEFEEFGRGRHQQEEIVEVIEEPPQIPKEDSIQYDETRKGYITWDTNQKYIYPYKDLSQEQADYFRPKLTSLLQGTWFLNQNLQQFISTGGGVKRVFDKLDVLIPQIMFDCLRNEVYQIPGESPLKLKYGVETKYHTENVDTKKSKEYFLLKSKLLKRVKEKSIEDMNRRRLRKTFLVIHSQTYNLFNHRDTPYVRYEILIGYNKIHNEKLWQISLWVTLFGHDNMDIEEWKAVQKCNSDSKMMLFNDPMRSEWRATTLF
ncbi:hypothetical protein WICPIJ_009324 [Wickerhamomyces pijperi]|uniref:Secreted protein n=1 Tax=Wickerhamomyces pijperi TaxID=599730 RepID=A0A9P8PQC3_WICPI|nr:hypothetical protein WICPIJ_009324 [Wickerhamomyces pijperi]